MSKNKIIIIIAIMFAFIVAAITIQIRTIKGGSSENSKIIANDNLRDEVLKWKNKYDVTLNDLEKANKKLDKIRGQIAKNDTNFEEKESSIKKYNNILGLTDVQGEGIIITIKTKQIDETTKEYLDNIINELKNAGAESISINDKRLIWSSTIYYDDNVINVNYEKIDSPFIIKAIGDTKVLYGAILRPGGYIELLNKSGIKSEVVKNSNLQIEKYNGLINFEYINNAS